MQGSGSWPVGGKVFEPSGLPAVTVTADQTRRGYSLSPGFPGSLARITVAECVSSPATAGGGGVSWGREVAVPMFSFSPPKRVGDGVSFWKK